MSNELHYLRSILGNLREVQAAVITDGPSLGGEVLADNIDWLDCYIDAREKGNNEAAAFLDRMADGINRMRGLANPDSAMRAATADCRAEAARLRGENDEQSQT